VQLIPILATAVLLSIFAPTPKAATVQKGAAFYTDVHGAAALVRCLHAMTKVDPKYRTPRDAAMNWMLRQMRDFPGAGRTWLQNPSAPQGHVSYHATVTAAANFNARTLLELFRETKDQRLMKAVKHHIDWLKGTALKQQRKAGVAHAWTGRHSSERKFNKRNRKFLLTSGNSRGFGNILDTFGDYYDTTGDKSVIPYLEGGARFGYLVSNKSDGTTPPIKPGNGGDKNRATANEHIEWVRANGQAAAGFCRGSAGNVYGMQTVQQYVPGANLTADRTIEDAINAGLRRLIAQSHEWNLGLTWKNMNGQPGALNIGFGRGVSGIALTLWRGYEMNRKTGNELMAKRCRETAETVIRGMLATVAKLESDKPLTEHVEANAKVDHSGKLNETIGYCSGIAGIHFWLFQFADTVRDEQPALAKRCEEATRIVARRLINTAYVVDGNYAWKNHNPKFGGEKVVNMAFDHGQTGVVTALAETAARVKDPVIIEAAHKAADFVLSQTVKAGDGIKMPFLVTIDSTSKPVSPRN
jgi:hypothetical protein